MRELTEGTAALELHVMGEEGRIGAFRAGTEPEGTALIARALDALRAEGCTRALGPIGRDTWGPYRLVVETDGTPGFAGEPGNPAFHVDCFTRNGFAPVAHYLSAIDEAPQIPRRDPPDWLKIGEWDPANPAGDLAAIHALANTAFADAPFFAPTGYDRFAALHAPLLATLPPRYCLTGRVGGEIVACLLGYPSPAGLVVKTLISTRKGAGGALLDEFYRRAVADGQQAVIHALMHGDNLSARMSEGRNARVFRRYALFGRAL
ncbi:MAG: hypothetical protein WCZ72_07100 [Gemmobacter sp.]